MRVPSRAHQIGSAAASSAPVQMKPEDDEVGSRMGGLSNAASLASAMFGLGKSAPATMLSGKLGALSHMAGAGQKGRQGDVAGMGFKGLSAFGALTGMLAPRLGMASRRQNTSVT